MRANGKDCCVRLDRDQFALAGNLPPNLFVSTGHRVEGEPVGDALAGVRAPLLPVGGAIPPFYYSLGDSLTQGL